MAMCTGASLPTVPAFWTTSTWEVRQEHTEGDGHHQHRLILLLNSQIEQEEGDQNHHQVTPAHLRKEGGETHRREELLQALQREIRLQEIQHSLLDHD